MFFYVLHSIKGGPVLFRGHAACHGVSLFFFLPFASSRKFSSPGFFVRLFIKRDDILNKYSIESESIMFFYPLQA